MERTFAFFLGFIAAGGIGWFSTSILTQWGEEEKWSKIFLEFFLRVVVLTLLLLFLFISIRTLIFFLLTPSDEIYEVGITFIFTLLPKWIINFLYGILSGIIFAFVLGFVLQNVRLNWAKIMMLVNSLRSPLDKISIQEPEEEITTGMSSPAIQKADDLKKQIDIKSRRLQKLQEKQAFYGKSVDPSVPMEIEEIESELEYLQTELAKLEANDSAEV